MNATVTSSPTIGDGSERSALDEVQAYLRAVGPLNLVGASPSSKTLRAASAHLDTHSLTALRHALAAQRLLHAPSQHEEQQSHPPSERGTLLRVERVIRLKLFVSGDVEADEGRDAVAREARRLLEQWMNALRQRCDLRQQQHPRKRRVSCSQVLREAYPRRSRELVRCLHARRAFQSSISVTPQRGEGDAEEEEEEEVSGGEGAGGVDGEEEEEEECSSDDDEEREEEDVEGGEGGESNGETVCELEASASIWSVAAMVQKVLQLGPGGDRKRKRVMDEEVVLELDGARVGPRSRREARANREVHMTSLNELQVARAATLPVRWMKRYLGRALASPIDRQLVNAFACEHLATLVQLTHIVRRRFAEWEHEHTQETPLQQWELRQAQRLVETLGLCAISSPPPPGVEKNRSLMDM
jgi:hypothetical protein